MILRIAHKELLDMFRDGRFRLSSAIVLLLLTLSLLTGWDRYQNIHRQQLIAERSAREHFRTQGEKNPHSAAHFGVYAFEPSLPLSFADPGISRYTGVAVWLEAHKQDDFKYKPAQDGTLLQRFGEMSAATVLQTLLPLLIVLLTFSAWAGEREQGTLRQLLSIGVARKDLVAGKALGIVAALAILVLPAALLGSALLVAGDAANIGDALLRTCFLTIFYLLYIGAFIGLALAISARARSPRSALAGLLAFWIFNCLVAPRLMTDLSRAAYPTPSSFAFAQAVDRDVKAVHSEKQTALFRKAVLAQYGVDSADKLPVSFSGMSLQHSEDTANPIFDAHYHDLWDRYQRQNRVQEAGAIFAPLLAVRSLSMALAGTDFDEHRRFAVAAENYRRKFIALLNGDITNNGIGKAVYIRGNDFWQQIPSFRFEAPGVLATLSNRELSIALLALWFVGCAYLALASALKIKPE